MNVHVVATGNHVWTPTGPALVGHVQPGQQLTVIDRGGSLSKATVERVEEVGQPTRSVRLLTGGGDVELALDALVTTRQGPRRVRDVLDSVRSGRSEKLEIIRSIDLPREVGEVDASACARAALRQLGGVVRVPKSLADGGDVLEKVHRVFSVASVMPSEFELERWVVLRCELPEGRLESPSPTALASVAETIHTLTAWELHGELWRSRLPLGDISTRVILIAGLCALGREFTTTWVPGYFPVECRLGLTAPPGSHREVVGTSRPSGKQLRVDLDAAPGVSLVVGRALVRS